MKLLSEGKRSKTILFNDILNCFTAFNAWSTNFIEYRAFPICLQL